MIPEYKLYHGAVLADLVHVLTEEVSIHELDEVGRLSSYILNGAIGLQIKHSSHRLHPWSFTFTRQNLEELHLLGSKFPCVYVVFVCHQDGMVCVNGDDLLSILETGESDQAWVKVDRRRGQWYAVWGGRAELPGKRPQGLDLLVEAVRRYPIVSGQRAGASENVTSERKTIRFPFSFVFQGRRQ